MEEVFFILLKILTPLALLFCIFVSIFIMYELWKMRDAPSYSDIIFKFLDIYTGPIEEEKMNRTDKEIPGYIQRMIEEKNELAERKNKLSAFIESGKAIELSSADYMDLLLQLNAMEEYHLILERRLNRAFNKEGIV